MTDLSPYASRVRARFGRHAVFTLAFGVLLFAVGIGNALSGFLGHEWFFTVFPLVLGFASLRSAAFLWNVRDQVAAGQARLLAMDGPTRWAKKRGAYRNFFLQLGVMAVIWITSAAFAGQTGFFVSLIAMLVGFELLGLVARLLSRSHNKRPGPLR